jgi:hypothetical protein
MTQQHLELGTCTPAVTVGWKVCNTCGLNKPPDAYIIDVRYLDNLKPMCRHCNNVHAALNYSDYRPRLIRRLYKQQHGLCPVCDKPINLEDSPHLDHPHSAEAMQDVHTLAASVTGLLHGTCNVGLGMLNDDPAVLRRAIRYIERTRCYGQQSLDL